MDDYSKRTYNISDETNRQLEQLKKLTGYSKSKLIEVFTKYFFKRKDDLEIKNEIKVIVDSIYVNDKGVKRTKKY